MFNRIYKEATIDMKINNGITSFMLEVLRDFVINEMVSKFIEFSML